MIYCRNETCVQLPNQMNLLANHVLDPITVSHRSHSKKEKYFEIDVGTLLVTLSSLLKGLCIFPRFVQYLCGLRKICT